MQKKCVVCRSEIDAQAAKCVKCGSFQDRSRHILKYSAVGAACLALVPFATIAVSLWQIAFGEQRADIWPAVIHCDQARVEIAFSNRGGLAGIVKNVSLEKAGDLNLPDTFSIEAEDGRQSFVVAADGAVDVVAYVPKVAGASGQFPKAPSEDQTCVYQFGIEIADFDAKQSRKDVTCDCPT